MQDVIRWALLKVLKKEKSNKPNTETFLFYLSVTTHKVEVDDAKGNLILKKGSPRNLILRICLEGFMLEKFIAKMPKNYIEKLIVK